MLKWAGKIHTMLSRETKFTCQLCYVNKGIFGFLFLDCVSRSSWVFYVVRLKEVKLSYLCSSPLSGTGQWSWANIWHGWCMVFSLNYSIWRAKVFDVLRDKWFTSEYKGFAQHDGLVTSLSERHTVPVWNLKCRLQQSHFEQLIQLISAHICKYETHWWYSMLFSPSSSFTKTILSVSLPAEEENNKESSLRFKVTHLRE